MSQALLYQIQPRGNSGRRSSQLVVEANACNELVLGVVGHVGSGTTTVCKLLEAALVDDKLAGGAFDVTILKASEVIGAWAADNARSVHQDRRDLKHAVDLQDIGDAMREKDHAAVARALVQKIRGTRAAKTGVTPGANEPVAPDGKRRAYILDSVRHPSEVFLLRNIYQSAFALIGVVCDAEMRLDRLTEKFSNAGKGNARQFMERDAKAKQKHGQRVDDAFHLSDFFLDNSAGRTHKDGKPNTIWTIPEQLSRFIKIVTHSEIVRPRVEETAMYFASGAQRRSACLSRQVGAALMDEKGHVIASGTNEVPRAGGGVYGQGFDSATPHDERCAYRSATDRRVCSNTQEQNVIIDKLIDDIPQLRTTPGEKRDGLRAELRGSRIGELLEFSRAVHAEMDALLAAARAGISTVGSRMFVTTFPCHYCARHIVAAGIDEVQYIESYPKSRALNLHDDSITVDPEGWTTPSTGGFKVLFRPFTGVAPRLYVRAFWKDRELKDKTTGVLKISDPDWGGPWDVGRLSYSQLEAELSKTE